MHLSDILLAVATEPVPVLQFLFGVPVSSCTSRLRVFFTIYGKFRTSNFSLKTLFCLQFIVEKKIAEKRMAGYRTRDPMITSQRFYRYTDMSFTSKPVRISYFNSITLYIEA